MRPGSSASETRFTAATPPKRLTTPFTSRIGATSDRSGQAVPLLQNAEDAARHQQHDGHDDRAEEQLMEIDELRPDHLLHAEQERRAEHWAPDGAFAAEQR